MDKSLGLVRLWTSLETIAKEINNVAIPLSHAAGIVDEDQELYDALNDLSEKIGVHFKSFKIQATRL